MRPLLKCDRYFTGNISAERADGGQHEFSHSIILKGEDSDAISKFFYDKTRSLLSERSFVLADKEVLNVDVLDIIKAVPLHWVMSHVVSVS